MNVDRMRQTRGLVLTPDDSMDKSVYSTIQQSLHEVGVQVYRSDEIEIGADLASTITDALRSADLLVVDVTRPNPNMFYELGFAHALRKPTILIKSLESPEAVPQDLYGF